METHVVTGAFSYTGKYIARRLLDDGIKVRTLTGHHRPHDPLSAQVETFPLDFDNPDVLAEHLKGATTLYNTYWIRFAHGALTFEKAVANSLALVNAAKAAGVSRIVHVSITNASSASPLPYFHGKGLVEEAIIASGLSHAIIRPTVVFGDEDILINNIAWSLRRFPLFTVPGSGEYSLQPIFVDDLAELAVEAGKRSDNVTMDAAGPERYTYAELVRLVGDAMGKRARIVGLPPSVVRVMAWSIGLLVRDVMLTRDEIRGLMANLLVSAEPRGHTSLLGWLADHHKAIGVRYASEMQRHYKAEP
jgi:uncharacterized protein YbjT (DUF2867 family)